MIHFKILPHSGEIGSLKSQLEKFRTAVDHWPDVEDVEMHNEFVNEVMGH